jgi:mannose/fructose/N-acetylgalactosamine-specific phosphotransferase system component IIC
MKIWSVIVLVGTIIFILGVIFHLQGQSIVGPESSFMYANPEWISYGIQIAVSGIVISGVGISIKLIKKN